MKKEQENPVYFVQPQKKWDNNDSLPAIEFLENIACEYDSEGTEADLAETLGASRSSNPIGITASSLLNTSVILFFISCASIT